jgi:uncharacterized protein (TIGR03067 family)
MLTTMKMTANSLWMLVSLVLVAATARADTEGRWRPIAAELGGKALPAEVYEPLRLTLTATTYTLTNDVGVDRGTLKIDATHKPKAMDITGTEGPNQGKTFLAIYQLEGEKLTICYDLSGKTRPTGFATQTGTQLFLVTYRRDKP